MEMSPLQVQREKWGFSRKDLDELMQSTPGTTANCEVGRQRCIPKRLKPVCDELLVDFDVLDGSQRIWVDELRKQRVQALLDRAKEVVQNGRVEADRGDGSTGTEDGNGDAAAGDEGA